MKAVLKMVYPKNKDKLTLAEVKRAELEKKAFDLGIEVGYNKHSEIGWVKENLIKLETLSKSLGLGDVITDHYLSGKQQGATAREKGLKLDALQKVEQDPSSSVEVEPFLKSKKEFDTGRSDDVSNDLVFAPVDRPKFLGAPECTSLTKAIDRPTNLDGFKPLNPRK